MFPLKEKDFRGLASFMSELTIQRPPAAFPLPTISYHIAPSELGTELSQRHDTSSDPG